METNVRAQVAVDIGGTFTDLVLFDGRRDARIVKVPSTPPDYSRGVVAALQQVLGDFGEMGIFLHGTTAPLNAFLERKGARTALLTTKGFGDVYHMGRGSRTRMYDLHYTYPKTLVPRHLIFEIEERLDARGSVLQPLERNHLPAIVKKLREQDVQAVAVCFLHSYVNPSHEEAVADFLRREAPGVFVSPSHEVSREWREFERTSTVVLNAYTSPVLASYLQNLVQELSREGYGGKVYLMQSNGGLIEAAEAESRGVLTLMSGPVGGSVGGRTLSRQIGRPNLICMDMGGTSFDVSLVVDGKAAVTTEKALGEFPVLAPMVDIHTIGAGGGSIAWSQAGALRVGPHSAGADPGPACYGKGGAEATVTDANLVLGRINPEGILGSILLHLDRAREAVERLGRSLGLSVVEMAEGIVDVVNAQMANAIRSVTISKGIDPRDFALVAFGGAGPMHAAFIAQELGVSQVIVPNVAGAFSAWGMLQTDIRHDASQTYIVALSQVDWSDVETRYDELKEGLLEILRAEQIAAEDMRFSRSLDMRYMGQEYFINVVLPERGESNWRNEALLKTLFDTSYEQQYGHSNLAEEVEIVNLRLEAIGLLSAGARPLPMASGSEAVGGSGAGKPRSVHRPAVFSGKSMDTLFVHRSSLSRGAQWAGPLIVEETSCTIVVPPHHVVEVDEHGNLIIQKKEPRV